MRKLAFTVGWKLVRWGNRNNKARSVEYVTTTNIKGAPVEAESKHAFKTP